MYHPDRKREFIDRESKKYGFSPVFAEEIFEALERYEIQSGQDVCEMTGSNLLRNVFNALSKLQTGQAGSRKITVYGRESALEILRSYGKWCILGLYQNASVELAELEDPAKVRYRFRFVANPTHLKLYLDDIFPLDNEHPTLNDVYQSFFWLAFSGLTEQDAIELTPDRINFKDMEIAAGGARYQVYAEAVRPFRNAAESTQLRINHPNYKKASMRDRAGGDLLLRGFLDFDFDGFRSAMARTMQRRYETDFLTPYLNYKNIMYSGTFYRCFMLEMAGMRLDFDEIAASAYVRRLGKNETLTPSNFNAKRRNIMAGYAEWKRVFAPKTE